MHEPKVWAPAARRVELVRGDGERVDLAPGPGGWWSDTGLRLAAGEEYAFALDGGPPLPDPRARAQPRGVHGPSAVVDLGALRWTDAGWRPPPLGAGVVYELHPGTFTPQGTFAAAIDKLEHLVELGVTHVELMPSCEFAGQRGWGYDGVLLFAPHQAYGGAQGLAALVDACHARGLAVLMDVVWNHFGPEGNYLSRFGPYFEGGAPTPWGEGPNLDGPWSDEVRRLFLDHALELLRDYHLDGLRVDAVDAFVDRRALHFLEELAGEVAALSVELGRELVLIGESGLNDPRLVRPREAGGLGFHAAWSDDLHGALHALLTGEVHGPWADYGRLADLAQALERVFVHEGGWSHWRQRGHGRPLGPEVPAQRFLGYLQNHDQVGNRPGGERIGQLVPRGRLLAGAALVLLGPCVPMLFMGEEWAASTPFHYFTDLEPELGRAVERGRRRGYARMGFPARATGSDPQDPDTCAASRLRWEERDAPAHREVLAWYRALIRLRRARPDLLAGDLRRTRVRFDEQAGWLVMDRGRTAVAVNFGRAAQRVALPRPGGTLLLGWPAGLAAAEGAVELPPDAVAVVGW